MGLFAFNRARQAAAAKGKQPELQPATAANPQEAAPPVKRKPASAQSTKVPTP